jgi:hypothetical protein
MESQKFAREVLLASNIALNSIFKLPIIKLINVVNGLFFM